MKKIFVSIIVAIFMSGSIYAEDISNPAISDSMTETLGVAGGYGGSATTSVTEGWVVYDASKNPIEAFGSDTSIQKRGDDLVVTGYTIPEGAGLQRAGIKEFGIAKVSLLGNLRKSAAESTKGTFVTLAETIAIASKILAEELCPKKLYPATIIQLGLTFDMKLLCQNYNELEK